MNRKSKIIVSIVSIFIILLALIGITYGYFLTRIEGNTNDTSISITTANLRIVYDDNDSQINVTNLQPSKNEYYVKTFTVTNEGNEPVDYEVYLENIINDFVNEEDLLMFITCESNISGNTCNGYGDGRIENEAPIFGTSIYPTVNSKLIENSIEPASDGVSKEIHTYKLYLMFYDDDSDQSDDMNKIIQGKVQIYDPKDVVSISGMLTGYEEGYYVQLQSEIKTSELKYEKTVDGVKYYSYIFYGVAPESDAHTLSIMKKGSVTPVVQKSINVTKGTNASVDNDASNIVIDDSTLNIELDITLTKSGETTSMTTTAGEIEKVKYLKDAILANNTAYADNVNSTYVQNATPGIDFSLPSSETNGRGLYYTSTNTEDNNTTYYFRGAVENNYVAFGPRESTSGVCMYDNEVVVDNNPDYIVTDPAACNNVQVCIGHPISGGYPSINIDREFCEEGGGSMSTGYANMVGIEKAALWKVIRINEDGSIRLMYVSNGAYDEESPNHPVYWISSSLTSNYGASSEYLSTIDSILNAWYETNLLDYNNYIFDSGFCNDISISILDENYYGIYDRLTNLKPKFVCSSSDNLYTLSNNKKGNEKLTYPIGLITADEAWYSGLFFDDSISDSHLSKAAGFWTMTPYGKQEPTYVAASGSLAQVESTAEIGLFPVINLKPSVQVVESSGYDIGTIDNPYVIKMTN